ncbi:SH3 domain-containing protein [Alcaligenes endophyticus]
MKAQLLFGLFVLVLIMKMCGGDDSSSRRNNQSSSTKSYTEIAKNQEFSAAMEPLPAKTEPAYEERYIGPKTLNIRSSPNGKIISSLKHGAKVIIYSEEGSWSKISGNDSPDLWVSNSHLCEYSDCSDQPKWKPAPPPPLRTITRSTPQYSSGCSCSSGNNCYGPRGGRYCITSGGNKRYR